ncbi:MULTISPECIES: hypothetical protein [unclassified Lysobacter]|uniref:hypothetical protein n=1 Tax=unclassified Lysobacter TaxID=2635362 RepID=UPI001BEA36F8|nr:MULTISPECIES: hypothetical protein [unclassified Lysobacter]MBT2750030.1 hypothetical protein [Lysobacter sp. ISL-50]MBT2775398.1 hypothetical protein [Lysobacter sp. ISL-54]MBT2783521.1 hypothetical protein [Lysobacter sp. ISL-52]
MTNYKGMTFGHAKLADTVAVIAPTSMFVSLGVTALAMRLQADVLSSIAWTLAIGSACCHAWFAWLRTTLTISLYQHLAGRWQSNNVPAVAPVRRRARGLVLGPVMAWVIFGLQLVWAMVLNVKYLFPITLAAYSVLIGMSAAYSLAFLHSHKALRSEIQELRSVPPIRKIEL